MTPGRKFDIHFDNTYGVFVKGEILKNGMGWKFIVTKVYKNTWWRKILQFFGFKTKYFGLIQVKEII